MHLGTAVCAFLDTCWLEVGACFYVLSLLHSKHSQLAKSVLMDVLSVLHLKNATILSVKTLHICTSMEPAMKSALMDCMRQEVSA